MTILWVILLLVACVAIFVGAYHVARLGEIVQRQRITIEHLEIQIRASNERAASLAHQVHMTREDIAAVHTRLELVCLNTSPAIAHFEAKKLRFDGLVTAQDDPPKHQPPAELTVLTKPTKPTKPTKRTKRVHKDPK